MFKLKWISFHRVSNLFLTSNDKSIFEHSKYISIYFKIFQNISKHQNTQDKKLCKFFNSVVGLL